MAYIEIYTWKTCPFCIRAKALLDSKGVAYKEHKIDGDEQARDEMAKRTGGKRSVPQIFVNDLLIGGCDDIYELDRQGELDDILNDGDDNDPNGGMHPA